MYIWGRDRACIFCDFGAGILNCGLRVVSLLEMRVGDEMPACCFNMLKYLAL
jgi:hypothetical protein